jgi:hypothetical protein
MDNIDMPWFYQSETWDRLMTCDFQTSPRSSKLAQKWRKYDWNKFISKVAICEWNIIAKDLKILVMIDILVP